MIHRGNARVVNENINWPALHLDLHHTPPNRFRVGDVDRLEAVAVGAGKGVVAAVDGAFLLPLGQRCADSGGAVEGADADGVDPDEPRRRLVPGGLRQLHAAQNVARAAPAREAVALHQPRAMNAQRLLERIETVYPEAAAAIPAKHQGRNFR